MSTQTLSGPMQAAAAPFSIRQILAPLTALILGTFMAILDSTVVNVALPTLGRVFAADLTLLQWVITGYTLAQAAVVPLAGWLSDRFGAKRLYVTALALFTMGSLLCALAPGAEALIVFRILQGLGGGMLMPVGMAFLYRLAPPDKRGAVMGAYGVPILLGPALGPVMSGWFLEFADWRLIFLINLPVGAVAVLLGLRWLPYLAPQRLAGALDVPGAVLGPLAFGSLTYGISQSTAFGWTGAPTLMGLGIGAAALVAFVARELTTSEPLLELRVFTSSDFTRTIATQWLAGTAMFGTMFLIPVFLQQVRGYGAFETGLATLPQAIVAAVFMPIGGRLFDRFGARPMVVSGLALLATSMALLSTLSVTTTPTDLVLPLALWGAGMGMMIMSLNTHLLNTAPRGLVSRVTSLSTALYSVVMSLAVAGSATLLQARTAEYFGAMGPGPVAMAAAFDDIFRLAAVVALGAIGLALTLRRVTAGEGDPPADQRTKQADTEAVVPALS